MKKLWNQLADRLRPEPIAEESEEHAIEFAAASLLLEVAQMDMQFDAVEREAIAQQLTNVYSLNGTEVTELIARAEREDDAAITYHPHVETINAHCDPAQKAQIIEQIWRVAYADGRLDKYEEHYLRRVAELIHVPHKVLLQTKHRVLDDQ